MKLIINNIQTHIRFNVISFQLFSGAFIFINNLFIADRSAITQTT